MSLQLSQPITVLNFSEEYFASQHNIATKSADTNFFMKSIR